MADTIERLATCARQLLDAAAEIERLTIDRDAWRLTAKAFKCASAAPPRRAEGWRTDIENLPKDGTDVIFPLELVGRAYWCSDLKRWVLTYPLHMEYVSRPTKFRLARSDDGETPDQEK